MNASTKTIRDLLAGLQANLTTVRIDLRTLVTDLRTDLSYLRTDLAADMATLTYDLSRDYEAWRDRRAMRKLGLCGAAPAAGTGAPRWWRCARQARHPEPEHAELREVGGTWGGTLADEPGPVEYVQDCPLCPIGTPCTHDPEGEYDAAGRHP